MSLLLNGDCLEQLSNVDDNSVDFIFCDLPYGQTSCKWDTIIPWEPFWKEIMRVKKINTPVFFTTTTKFGVQLINSAPKKCPFRWDMVWVKSAPAGFLSAKKMPMRKHEMVYCFYEKLPFYDLSSHKHKFIKTETTSVVKEVKSENNYHNQKVHHYTDENGKRLKGDCQGSKYDPPLPVSVVKEEIYDNGNRKGGFGGDQKGLGTIYQDPALISSQDVHKKNGLKSLGYDPPLPTSVVKEEGSINNYKAKRIIYTDENGNKIKEGQSGPDQTKYDPPLPTSVVKEEKYDPNEGATMINGTLGGAYDSRWQKGHQGNSYDPPLPNSLLEIKSTRGKHSTEKPVALMEWLLKYFLRREILFLTLLWEVVLQGSPVRI